MACTGVLPLCGFADTAVTLAEAAERFAERSLSLTSGSARAQSIDREIPLGTCPSGWDWSFPYEARTTVQVSCTASPSVRRYVSMRYELSSGGNTTPSNPKGSTRFYVSAARDMAVGQVLSATDLEVTFEAPAGRPLTSTLSDPDSLIGLALTRPVRRGETLGRADARPHVVIRRKALVSGWYAFPGGRVHGRLIASENGKIGEWIELENPQSGRKLRGRVQPDGSVQIGVPNTPLVSTLAGGQNPALPVD
jgi:flagella basal body P-ring formation protein FlgA